MTAVLARARAEIRRRWLAWVAIGVLAGAGGGVVLAALAAARRTESAYPRMLAASRPADALVPGRSAFGLLGGADTSKVVRLPQVADSTEAAAVIVFTGRAGNGRLIGPGDMIVFAARDRRLGRSIERWHMLSGRRADPDRVDEAVASFTLAENLGLHIGSTLQLGFFRADSFNQVAARLLTDIDSRLRGRAASNQFEQLADGPQLRFRIVGIESSAAEFPPLTTDLAPALHLTPAFYRRYQPSIVQSSLAYVRLRNGAVDLNGFKLAVESLAGGEPVSFSRTQQNQAEKVARSAHHQAVAAQLFALVTAAALIVVVGQALARQVRSDAADRDVLAALGMTRRELWALLAMAAGIAAAVAAAVATAVTVALSPLGPVGVARKAELHPGVHVDGLILGVGPLAVLLVVLVLAAWPARRAVAAAVAPVGRAHGGRRTPSPVAAAIGRAALPQPAAVGVRFALERGQGDGAVPVRMALVGGTVAIAAMVGAGTFALSANHLLATPPLYGWTWELRAGAPALPDIGGVIAPALAANRDVAAVASGTDGQVQVGPTRVDILALRQVKGDVEPTIVEGRAPVATDEIVLGRSTLRAAGRRVGDSVDVSVGPMTASMRIVGRAVFPDLGDAGQLGTGALVTFDGLARVLPTPRQNIFLVNFRPGVDATAAERRLREALHPVPVQTVHRPPDLRDLAAVSSLPAALSIVLAGLAAAALAHTLIISVRRRRREIAILKTFGFVRGQVLLTVVWQATTLIAAALVLGIPLGSAGGRLAWSVFSTGLGVEADPVVPAFQLAIAVPAAILVANAIAAVPAFLAGRTRPAVVLAREAATRA